MLSAPFSSVPIAWRVPNRLYAGLAILVVALTWVMILIAYPLLPSRIPMHFALSGEVDGWATKRWWLVLLPAIFQSLLVPLTIWLGRHPEWSNLPSRRRFHELDEQAQRLIRILLAHMLVMIGLIASLAMAHISLAMIRVGVGLTDRLNSWVLIGLTVLLLTIIGAYTFWLRQVIAAAEKRSARAGVPR